MSVAICTSAQQLCNIDFTEFVCSVFQGWLCWTGSVDNLHYSLVLQEQLGCRTGNINRSKFTLWLQQTHISFYSEVREEEGSALRGLNSVREFSGITLAVSRRVLPVKTSRSCGISGEQICSGADFFSENLALLPAGYLHRCFMLIL